MGLLAGLLYVAFGRPGAKQGALQAGLEIVVLTIADQLRQILGRDPWPYIPLLGSLFLFLCLANLAAVFPGATPPTGHIETPAALALIVASGTAATIQFGALVVFNVVAFALVEIPLLCYLVAPDRTRAALSALYDWVRLRGRYGVAALLVVVGAVLIGVGLSGL